MGQRQGTAADFAVYLVVRILVCTIQALPMEVAGGIARWLGRLGYLLDRRHRAVALHNLQMALGPTLSERDRHDIVRAVYEHFARVIVEIAFIPRKLRLTNWKRYITLEGGKEAVAALLDDRPRIIITGHWGNWEMAGYFLAALGVRSHAIARDLDNPYLHDFLLRFRQWSGQTILSKKGDFERIERVLAERGLLVTVGDQSAGPRGYFVDFFGRPASTHKAVALMAMEYAAPILVSYAYRDRPGFHYRVGVARVLDPADYAGRPDGALALTADFTRELERVIRRAPEQYLWLHNRWKHAPPVKGRPARAA